MHLYFRGDVVVPVPLKKNRSAFTTRNAVLAASFSGILAQLRLECRLWPSITRDDQLSALSSPLTASELEGAIGVVKAFRHSAPHRTEPVLRSILLERRVHETTVIVSADQHSAFIFRTARRLLSVSARKRNKERADRQLRGRVESESSASESSGPSLSWSSDTDD